MFPTCFELRKTPNAVERWRNQARQEIRSKVNILKFNTFSLLWVIIDGWKLQIIELHTFWLSFIYNFENDVNIFKTSQLNHSKSHSNNKIKQVKANIKEFSGQLASIHGQRKKILKEVIRILQEMPQENPASAKAKSERIQIFYVRNFVKCAENFQANQSYSF